MANKLELTWVGKDKEIKVEPRILIENPELSNTAQDASTENMLIHGDNLLALKALESKYAGQIKCIYIDPPYNTGNAFDEYDDGIEHSIWLNLMYRRVKLLYSLLSQDGVFFCNLDETEHAYMKVLCDQIFGRNNYIGDIIWKKRKGGGNDSRFIALDHDYILVYVKDSSKEIHKTQWLVSQSETYQKRYKETDSDGRRYYWDTLSRDGLQNPIPVNIECPDGTVLSINSQKSKETIEIGLQNGTIKFSKTKRGWTLHHKVYLKGKQVMRSILDEIGTNKTAGDEMLYLFGNAKSFPYPKPENLIQKILELNTNKGDLVLDSFLGSGTTAAVAHKMGRRYIGIEMGNHAYTHCKVRLDKVVSGEDKGGITKSVDWQGGGGYRFYELAPTLILQDDFGQEIINPEYNAEMLASAVALHEGYTYSPDENCYFKQAYNGNNAYLYVTTRHINRDAVNSIAAQLAETEYLIIVCKSFDGNATEDVKNITVKKIPQSLLDNCEFGKDDYKLNIISPPIYNDEVTEENE